MQRVKACCCTRLIAVVEAICLLCKRPICVFRQCLVCIHVATPAEQYIGTVPIDKVEVIAILRVQLSLKRDQRHAVNNGTGDRVQVLDVVTWRYGLTSHVSGRGKITGILKLFQPGSPLQINALF